MSRGGGRGGGRGGRLKLPWEATEEPDARPTERFPAYGVPVATPISATEQRVVDHFLRVRAAIRHGPMHVHPSSGGGSSGRLNPVNPIAAYGAAARPGAARYGAPGAADVDPFTAVPTYENPCGAAPSALPSLKGLASCAEIFPEELYSVIGAAAPARTRPANGAAPARLASGGMRARIGARGADLMAQTALMVADLPAPPGDNKEDDTRDNNDPEDEDAAGEQDTEDVVYDDEDAGDYDAEAYFDGGVEGGDDDYGDDGDGGTY